MTPDAGNAGGWNRKNSRQALAFFSFRRCLPARSNKSLRVTVQRPRVSANTPAPQWNAPYIEATTFHGGTPITSDQIPVDLSVDVPRETGFHRGRSDLGVDPRGSSRRMTQRSCRIAPRSRLIPRDNDRRQHLRLTKSCGAGVTS